jgi:hypothetical protein
MVLLDTIEANLPKIMEKGTNIIVALLEGTAKMLPKVIQGAFDVMLAFVNGLADSIRKNTPQMIEAISNLMTAIRDSAIATLKAAIPDFVKAGADIVGGLIDGIKGKIKDAAKAAANLAGNAFTAAQRALESKSPSKKFAELGISCVDGMAGAMNKYSDRVSTASEDMANGAIDVMQDAISSISDIINDDLDGAPTIRPVIDLTDIKMGVKSIDTLLSQNRSIDVSATKTKAAQISNSMINGKNDSGSTTNKTTTNQSNLSVINNYYSPKALDELTISRNQRRESQRLQLMLASS